MHFTKSPVKQRNQVNISTNNMGQHYSKVRVPIKNFTTTSVGQRVDKNMSNLRVPEHLPNNLVNLSSSTLNLKEPSIFVENNTNTAVNDKLNVTMTHIPSHSTTNAVNPLFVLQLKPALAENKTNAAVNNKLNVAMTHIPAHPGTNVVNPLGVLQLNPVLEENKISAAVNNKLNVAMAHIPAHTGTNVVNPLSVLQINSVLAENKTNAAVNNKLNEAMAHIPSHSTTNVINPLSVLQIKPVLAENKTNAAVNNKLNEAMAHPTTTNVVNQLSVLQINSVLAENKTNAVKNNKFNLAMAHIPVPIIDVEHIKREQLHSLLKLIHLRKATIENVYQERYNNNVLATGLGDFIRGSYFLMEFCDCTHIPCHINIQNHPVSQFLEIGQHTPSQLVHKINKFEHRNHHPHILENKIITNKCDSSIHDSFLIYLSKQHAVDQTIYVYTISYPSTKISEKNKTYMRQILKPSNSLALLVDKTLIDLGLVKKQFTIIHIRYGDNFLIKHNEHIKKSHLKQLQNTLNNLNSTQTYLLISDNTIIKNILLSRYPFIKTHFNDITHTGEGLHLETQKLQNTMIDFNLFSHAANVIAFSTYIHGTGFSKWSAETYSVPYVCRLLS